MSKEKESIHRRTWFIILMLFIVPPLGIAFLWVSGKFNKVTRIVITVFFSILTIGALATMDEEETSQGDQDREPEQEQPEEVASEESEDKPEATDVSSEEVEDKESEVEEVTEEEPIEPTPKEKMFADILDLIDEGKAFDTGSYIKGDIPKGEYAFVRFDGSGQYYSEEDSSGNIIGNENFDSFGYVQVHEAGNIESRGALINVDALNDLDASGAKEIYEVLNDLEDYKDAGWYKVGVDIDPGEYIIESYGEAYAAVMSGPVGNDGIVDNNIFNGRYSVNVSEGQYLVVSKGTITTE
ncbi:hypothetical protein JNUCC1_03341 [Lentibacillus sp. JNUCC-1]|uniref:hypothetical protein n=1 Tax=Lentibacillus sp. JNUCC-1 TaxID=2654513 RepID=UPI0012E9142C|nr:hypothetical protein [Lentibacillus sp. JNUCC-1]MUV39463.1 hypothetical protein [Lentibacillus sp. JNUCC-1]